MIFVSCLSFFLSFFYYVVLEFQELLTVDAYIEQIIKTDLSFS